MRITARGALLFWTIAIVWFAFDRLTKLFMEGVGFSGLAQMNAGISGVFRFTLVHNAGAAWGIFADSTFILGVVSLVVSLGIIVLVHVMGSSLNPVCIIGLSLVASGGLGNALDRFLYGYVVDFIQVTFIDFPVFNIADIGVTCGVVLFFIGFILLMRAEAR